MQHYVPKIVKSLQGIQIGYVASHCSAAHSVLITADGVAMTMGKNDRIFIYCIYSKL